MQDPFLSASNVDFYYLKVSRYIFRLTELTFILNDFVLISKDISDHTIF